MRLRAYILRMMTDNFTHEVCDDPLPRRRVRISGPVYDDGSVPLLRVEYEDGDAALLPPGELLLFRPLVNKSAPSPSFTRRATSRRFR
jgi:hypothetical protein